MGIATVLRLCVLISSCLLYGCDAISEKAEQAMAAPKQLIQRVHDCHQKQVTQIREACEDVQADDTESGRATNE